MGLSELELPTSVLAESPLDVPLVTAQVFETLLDFDGAGNITAGLAKSWEWDGENTCLTLHLRDAVRFHDGSPLVAETVVSCLMSSLDDSLGGDGLVHRLLGRPTAIAAPDDSTVQFLLPAPRPSLLRSLASISVFPIWQRSGNGEVVGTGPFRIERVDPARGLVQLARNDDYWKGPVWPARVRLLAFRDPESALDAIERGDLDILLTVSVGDLNRIQRSTGMSLVTGGLATYITIGLNNRRPPFTDPSVRAALREAVDWPSLARRLYPSSAAEITDRFTGSILLPRLPETAVTGFRNDPAWARRILASLPEEQRRIRMVFAPSFSADRRHWVLNVLGPALGEVGLVLEPDFTVDMQDAVDKISTGEWEISFDGLRTETGDLFEFLYTLYAEPAADGGNGIFFMEGGEVARLLERAAVAIDSEAAVAAYREVVTEIAHQIPCIPFCELPSFIVRSDEVEPFDPGPYYLWRLDRVWKRDW